MSQTTDAMRAGRIVLAVADEDQPQLIRTMHETMTEPTGILGLVVSLATMCAEFAEADVGPDWRAVMSMGINGLDVDAALRDDDTDDGRGVE